MRKRDLIGRTIVDVDWRRFATGKKDAPFACRPLLILDNGRILYFTVQETETGDYGVDIDITRRQGKP
jgi:hypothetical protein